MTRPIGNGYCVIAACLGDAERVEADRIAALLKDLGWPHSNRSLVIREAVSYLGDELRGKSVDETFRFFVDRRRLRTRRNVKPPTTPA